MSDVVEKTAAGATRGFFGALGFILLLLGLEGMTGAAGIQFGVGLFLALIGFLCFYAAFFWENAKKVLSVEAQQVIARFAQSRITWFGMLFLVLQTLILSRFVEEHRWPFSYPTDPAVLNENRRLQNDIATAKGETSQEKVLANNWRFASTLRHLDKVCSYRIQSNQKAASTINFWRDLLRAGEWVGDAFGESTATQPGITLRISGNNSQCAGTLQMALTDIYPNNPPSKIASNQQTDFLNACGTGDCVQIEINY